MTLSGNQDMMPYSNFSKKYLPFHRQKSAETSKYFPPPISSKNLTSWSITLQKLINIALVVLKMFKFVKSTTFPRTYDTRQA